MKADNGLTIMGTYTEWKETSYAREGVQCQGCHMPVIEGKIVKADIKESREWINLHDLQGGHSVSQLAKAMKVEILDVISAQQGVNVKVGITNTGSGHYVPTGHPARQLVLRLLVKDPKGQIIHQDERVFKKTLVDKDGKELKYKHEFLKAQRVLMDNRIPPHKRQEETFFIPKSINKGTIEVKLFYNFTPEIIQTHEMLIEMGSDNRVIH